MSCCDAGVLTGDFDAEDSVTTELAVIMIL